MTSDADNFWDEIAPKYRKLKGFCPLTPADADAAFDDAPEIPMSQDEIRSIVDAVVAGETLEWESEATEWSPDGSLETVEDEMLALYREEGETDPETDTREEALRKRMLNNESTSEQDGVDGGTTPPGTGSKDS